jgi:hypothetical protein
MMLDWNKYRQQLVVGVKDLGQLSPDTIRGYVELSWLARRRICLERRPAN